MTTKSIHTSAKNASLTAAECALVRWWPHATLASHDATRAAYPGYPLIGHAWDAVPATAPEQVAA